MLVTAKKDLQDEKALLQNKARELADALRKSGSAIKLSPHLGRVTEDEEDKKSFLYIVLGQLSAQSKVKLVIYLGPYLTGGELTFWLGFESEEMGLINNLAWNLPGDYKVAVRLKDGDIDDAGSYWAVKSHSAAEVYKKPIFESYERDGYTWLGIFQSQRDYDAGLILRFIDAATDDVSADIAKIEADKSLKPTQRRQLIQARLGQGQFRADLEDMWGNSCAVTKVNTRQVLRASHIKPWKNFDPKEKLDPSNGLLLSANLDALFDKHLISFREDGAIIISPEISAEERQRIGLSDNMRIDGLKSEHQRYLDSHRKLFQEFNNRRAD